MGEFANFLICRLLVNCLERVSFSLSIKRLKYSPPPEGWRPTKEDNGVVFFDGNYLKKANLPICKFADLLLNWLND